MNAIVTAGGVPEPDEPLYPITQGQPKALIPIAGRPMVAYVVEALARSGRIEPIVLVGLPPEIALTLPAPVVRLPSYGGMLENIEAGLDWLRRSYPHDDRTVLCSSDIPLITPEIVNAHLDTCLETDHDLYYAIVEKSVMEARFPGSRRTYARIKDGTFTGGDLNMVRTMATEKRRDLLQKLIAARKSPLRQARLIGFWPLVRFITRQITIAEAQELALRILGLRGRAIISPYAELAMDVDKPWQLEIVRRELETRAVTA